MPRIALINVKYSPNLGDGIIAECLESELVRIHPDWEVRSIDLAGREQFGSGLDAGRGKVLEFLDTLPPLLRRWGTVAALILLIQLRYRNVWRRQLKGVSGVIVGGGQLFADTDLNFPLKLHAALRQVGRLRPPAAIFGVGVSESLSKSGRRLFLDALSKLQLAHVAVRDFASRDNWNRHFGRSGIAKAALCCDPGLLAADVYPAISRLGKGDAIEVGIGLANPRTLDLHSKDDGGFSLDVARKFWAGLAKELISRNFRVTLFTNGPHDGEVFLKRVLADIDDIRVRAMPRPLVPRQLAETISAFDAIVAHRLHAHILAYAYRIPHVGMAWDPKVDAFFESVGRSRFMANHTQFEPRDVANLIEASLRKGIDSTTHTAVIEKTRAAIKACAKDLAAQLSIEGYSSESEFQDPVRA